MRKLLLFILVISLFACVKDQEKPILPKRLQDIIAQTSCVNNPQLSKCFFAGKVIYVMKWNVMTTDLAPVVVYDEDGNQFTGSLGTGNLQFLEVVWKCKP